MGVVLKGSPHDLWEVKRFCPTGSRFRSFVSRILLRSGGLSRPPPATPRGVVKRCPPARPRYPAPSPSRDPGHQLYLQADGTRFSWPSRALLVRWQFRRVQGASLLVHVCDARCRCFVLRGLWSTTLSGRWHTTPICSKWRRRSVT